MLVARLHKPPIAKKLEGAIERGIDLPAGTMFVLHRQSEHEWHLVASTPLKRLMAKVREAIRALFEEQSRWHHRKNMTLHYPMTLKVARRDANSKFRSAMLRRSAKSTNSLEGEGRPWSISLSREPIRNRTFSRTRTREAGNLLDSSLTTSRTGYALPYQLLGCGIGTNAGGRPASVTNGRRAFKHPVDRCH